MLDRITSSPQILRNNEERQTLQELHAYEAKHGKVIVGY